MFYEFLDIEDEIVLFILHAMIKIVLRVKWLQKIKVGHDRFNKRKLRQPLVKFMISFYMLINDDLQDILRKLFDYKITLFRTKFHSTTISRLNVNSYVHLNLKTLPSIVIRLVR